MSFSVDELFFGEKLKGTRMCMADCDDYGWLAEILDHEVEPAESRRDCCSPVAGVSRH